MKIFFLKISKQLRELNSKFNDLAVELLTSSSILIPIDAYKLHVCFGNERKHFF